MSLCRVYVFFFTCLSTCVASAAWFVFSFVFITTFFFPEFFFVEFNRYLCHYALDVRISLLLYLSPLLICIFIILIPAYVYLNIHTHSYWYTFIAILICIFDVLFYIYTHLFVLFLLFPKHNRHLCYGVYWCNHTPSHILILRFLLFFPICILYIYHRLDYNQNNL